MQPGELHSPADGQRLGDTAGCVLLMVAMFLATVALAWGVWEFCNWVWRVLGW